MNESKELRRRRRVAACLCVISGCLLLLGVGRHHLLVTFVCIGVEAIMLVVMLREVAAMQKGE